MRERVDVLGECLICKAKGSVIRRGFFERKSDRKIIQKYYCKKCRKSFSQQTLSYDYRLRKRYLNQAVFKLICKGVSQRGIAQILNIKQTTVAVRIKKYGFKAREHLERTRETEDLGEIFFDEMETFEHSKCKPLTIPLAVNPKNRKILSLSVGKIPPKKKLTAIALKKYGIRKSEKKKKIKEMLMYIRKYRDKNILFSSDQATCYPNILKELFLKYKHFAFKGKRGCIVGQGELKASGRDPLFALNHSCAMIRDNVKRLSRRTWCTTKRIHMLEHILYIYAYFHNLVIDKAPLLMKNVI